MPYFELFNDMRLPERWALRSPVDEHGQEVDPWQFFKGRPLTLPGTPRVALARPGRALDFTLTGLSIPVVHGRVASLLESLGLQQQAQCLPTQVEGQSEPYFLLNVLRVLHCIDEARCEEVRYTEPEETLPDAPRDYEFIRGLRIDPSRVGDADLFRPWGWSEVLIISERLKRALEQAGCTGTRFTEV